MVAVWYEDHKTHNRHNMESSGDQHIKDKLLARTHKYLSLIFQRHKKCLYGSVWATTDIDNTCSTLSKPSKQTIYINYMPRLSGFYIDLPFMAWKIKRTRHYWSVAFSAKCWVFGMTITACFNPWSVHASWKKPDIQMLILEIINARKTLLAGSFVKKVPLNAFWDFHCAVLCLLVSPNTGCLWPANWLDLWSWARLISETRSKSPSQAYWVDITITSTLKDLDAAFRFSAFITGQCQRGKLPAHYKINLSNLKCMCAMCGGNTHSSFSALYRILFLSIFLIKQRTEDYK